MSIPSSTTPVLGAGPAAWQTNAHLNQGALPTGTWRGEDVQVADRVDPLADAAEELGRDVGQERSNKLRLGERQIGKRRALKTPAMEQIERYFHDVAKDDQHGKMNDFLASLKERARSGNGNGAGASALARRTFSNPTDRFLALAFAHAELKREGGDNALLRELSGALERQQDEAGPHILADLNTAQAASGFALGEADRVADFQVTYRDAVLGEHGLPALLRATLSRFGETDYAKAIASLILALGADLHAIQGSATPVRLNAVLQELFSMQVLATVLEKGQALATRLHAEHGITLPAGDLLSEVVDASAERWIGASRFTSIADQFGAHQAGARIALLSGSKNMVRSMPPKMFADADARNNALDAAQLALDQAIGMEDA